MKLPSPRLTYIDTSNNTKRFDRKPYYNLELRELIPTIFRNDSANNDIKKTFYVKKHEPVGNKPYKFDVGDILRRSSFLKTGQNS